MKKITPQTPERIKWEEAVMRELGSYDVTRSDAQDFIEADEELCDSLFQAGTEPAAAARRLMD